MSAFVVSTETMRLVARTICARNHYGQIIRAFDGIDTSSRGAMTEIGRRLFTLNIEAVCQRYPDTQNNPGNLPGPADDDGKSTAFADAARFSCGPSATVNMVAGLKALQRLSYQCSEGNVPETALYKELDDAISAIAQDIVRSLPAYEAAAWG